MILNRIINKMNTVKRTILIILVPICLFFNSCAGYQESEPLERMSIGLLLPNTDGVSWGRDEGYLMAKADEFGVKVLTRVARGDQKEQNRQARELISEGVGVLVVFPVDPESAGAIVERAHESAIPVLAYDKLIRDVELDLYIAPDRELSGYLQSRALLERSTGGGEYNPRRLRRSLVRPPDSPGAVPRVERMGREGRGDYSYSA